MKASIELSLKTREVYKLFERKINGDRLFIASILHKFNLVMRGCRQKTPEALGTFNQMKQSMMSLTQQFAMKHTHLENLLQKKKVFTDKKINLITQFHPTISICNPLCIDLIEFIETYDKLIAIIKILHLAGCFGTGSDYYANIKRIQMLSNQMLSNILLLPALTFN